MQTFEKRFRDFWDERLRVDNALPLLVAVSSGVDSMALATVLHRLGFSFAIAHCNFKLRGEESDADAAFVEAWAEEKKVSFYQKDFDTKVEMQKAGSGIQETARQLRYDWFENLRREHHFAAVATAHHADDSAETVLMNLFRGTGIRGLHGILPKQERLIRPLLFATKKEILSYAAERGISFREDASNADNDYARNGLRHEVIPAVEAQYPQALKAIAETALRIAGAENLYQKSVEKLRKKLLEPRGADFYLPVRLWEKTVSADALIYELLQPFGFSAAATQEARKLFRSQSGQYLDSPTHRLLRHRDFLVLTARNEETPEADLLLVEKGTENLLFAGGTLHFERTIAPQNFPVDLHVAYLNPTALDGTLVLRRWKKGDYFYPLGMGGKKKKIARFLTDLKLSLVEKEKVWVLQSGERIAWVVGLRTDERFKVKAGREEALHVRYIPNL